MRKECVVAVLAVACCAWAEDLEEASRDFATNADCKKMCEEVMGLVTEEKFGGVFDKVEPYWLFPEEELTNMRALTIKQMEKVKTRFGEVVGYVLVKEETIGDTVIRYSYIQKYERHMIRWAFVFYKPTDEWLLNAMTWDDAIGELFE